MFAESDGVAKHRPLHLDAMACIEFAARLEDLAGCHAGPHLGDDSIADIGQLRMDLSLARRCRAEHDAPSDVREVAVHLAPGVDLDQAARLDLIPTCIGVEGTGPLGRAEEGGGDYVRPPTQDFVLD